MAEVAAALGAANLGPRDDHAPVPMLLDGALVQRGVEARPASAGVELRVGAEQLCAASGARVHALVVHVHVLPGERTLGARLAKHGVLLGRQALTPLVVGEGDFLVHGPHVFPRFAGPDAYISAAAAWVWAIGRRSEAGAITS